MPFPGLIFGAVTYIPTPHPKVLFHSSKEKVAMAVLHYSWYSIRLILLSINKILYPDAG